MYVGFIIFVLFLTPLEFWAVWITGERGGFVFKAEEFDFISARSDLVLPVVPSLKRWVSTSSFSLFFVLCYFLPQGVNLCFASVSMLSRPKRTCSEVRVFWGISYRTIPNSFLVLERNY
ncbi:hypothetical protein Nepgr_029353 [Nepenthes gracilis]|uniref:Uncharacterized protein n=1 Tax=Nepenthes gracilis TaxID=150966 RepID=A0AAD3Y4S2_NEPGR|nr:hypothetical protein Nepgr_029353 [Nepenthes gracilis]